MEKARSTFGFMQGNVLILTVCRVLWTLSLWIVYPFFPLYIRALGGSPVEIGIIYAIGGLAGLILYPVGGYIADHRGRVKLVVVATCFFTFSFVFFIVAQHWTMLAIGQFIQNLVLFYLPAMNAITADSLPPRQRGIGFATMTAIPQTIGFMAPAIGGYLISVYGVVPAMRICYMVGLVNGVLVFILRLKLKETLEESDPGVPLRNIPLLLKTSYSNIFDSIKWMPRTLRYLTIIMVAITLFGSIAGPFWIVYAKDFVKLTEAEWGALLLLVGAVGTILSIPMGHLVDRYGVRRTILLAMLLAPIPVGLFIYCQNILQVFAVTVILAVANSFLLPASATLMANVIPRKRRGRLLALLGQGLMIPSSGGAVAGGFLLFIPLTVGSFIGGYIYNFDPKYPWFTLAAATLLCFILSYWFVREPEEPEV